MDFDAAAYRAKLDEGTLLLLDLKREAESAGIQCVLYVSSWDVPKLYAVMAGLSGPHEIVCATGELDIWRSPDGRSPQPVKMNVSRNDAIHTLTQDYQRLKKRAEKTVQ